MIIRHCIRACIYIRYLKNAAQNESSSGGGGLSSDRLPTFYIEHLVGDHCNRRTDIGEGSLADEPAIVAGIMQHTSGISPIS